MVPLAKLNPSTFLVPVKEGVTVYPKVPPLGAAPLTVYVGVPEFFVAKEIVLLATVNFPATRFD
jgi:hypothetical protein